MCYNCLVIKLLKTVKPGRAVLRTIAEELVKELRNKSLLDLSAITFILPGQRAGRRFLEILSEICAREKLLFLPPKTETDVSFLRRLAREAAGPSLASPFEVRDVWRKAFDAERGRLEKVFAMRSEGTDIPESVIISFSERLEELRKDLALNLVSCRKVREALADLAGERESERWEELEELFARYLGELEKSGLKDECLALEEYLSSPLGEKRTLYVIGYRERIPLLEALYERPDFDVSVVAVGEDWFDEKGLLKNDAAFPPLGAKPEAVKIFADPTAEAEGVFAKLRELSPNGELSCGDVTIATQDGDLVPFLKKFGSAAKVQIHEASGRPFAETEPGLFLRSLAELLEKADVFAYLRALRLPCLERGVTKGHLEDFLPGWLDSLEKTLGAYPKDWMFAKTGNETAKQVFDWLEALIAPWRQERSKQEWLAVFRETLLKILPGQTPEDASAWEKLAEHAEALASSRVREGKITGLAFLKRLSKAARNIHIASQTETNALDLTGWLEVFLDDSPVIIICDLNEDILPKREAADLFLPDQLKTRLGMTNCEDVMRRDRYFLRTLADPAAETCLFSCKQSLNGFFRDLSPLLCDESESVRDRAEYIRKFYSESSAGEKSLFPSLFLPKPPEEELSLNIREKLERSLGRVSVSRLNDFRECPFKFALRQLGVDGKDRIYNELPPLFLGNIAHEVMELFAKAKIEGRVGSDPEECEKFLTASLESVKRRELTGFPPALADFQLDQLSRKFGPFSLEHCRREEEGWRIVQAEEKLEKDIDGIVLTGRLDRLDQKGEKEFCVVDYKTGAAAKKPKDLEEDLQMSSYAALLEERYPKSSWRSSFVNFSGEKRQPCFYLERELETPMIRLRAVLADIRESSFGNVYDPKNKSCGKCPYRFFCEMSAEERFASVEELLCR